MFGMWGRQPAAHLTQLGFCGILGAGPVEYAVDEDELTSNLFHRAGPGREALLLLVSLLFASKFCESVRPSSRWVLLTRILFVTCHHPGQQTQGASWRQGEFSLIARLLTSSGARDPTSLG